MNISVANVARLAYHRRHLLTSSVAASHGIRCLSPGELISSFYLNSFHECRAKAGYSNHQTVIQVYSCPPIVRKVIRCWACSEDGSPYLKLMCTLAWPCNPYLKWQCQYTVCCSSKPSGR